MTITSCPPQGTDYKHTVTAEQKRQLGFKYQKLLCTQAFRKPTG